MSNWIVITAADLNDYNVAQMMDTLREEALAEGQADPFDKLMHDRCRYIQNRISQRVQISATAYAVPPELKTCACWLIIEAMSTRLSIAIELTRDQRTAIDRAYKDLDIAGTKDLPISTADDAAPAAVQSKSQSPRMNQKPRNFSRANQDGV
jgi:hypothetical protein